MKAKEQIKIPKRGIWGGYTILRVGPKARGYFWIGEGEKYLMAVTVAQARSLIKFMKQHVS